MVTDAINNRIGAEFTNCYSIEFEEHDGKDVMVVDVFRRAPKEAFLETGKDTEFFVRTSNKTIPLRGHKKNDCIQANW
jgi:hypothetical protein